MLFIELRKVAGSGIQMTQIRKLINSEEDLQKFSQSQAYDKIFKLVNMISQAVIGMDTPSNAKSEAAVKLVKIFENLEELTSKIAPHQDRQRFGNLAYREWSEQMLQVVPRELRLISDSPVLEEVIPYFTQSFGNPQRLDFGTGHELNFLAFIGALLTENIAGELKGDDVLKVFDSYYKVCRGVIRTYNLEPAGSHGVWGLDDHFHLAYIFGAAQLRENPSAPKPKDVLNIEVVRLWAPINLYFASINFIYQMKRGPFFEHSPMLFDASNALNWTKINRGLIKMYVDEVLTKFPVVQHFWLGSVYSLEPKSDKDTV